MILLAIRLPVMIAGDSLTIPELSNMVLGEKLASGNQLYTEIWDNAGPLAAGVYWLIHLVGGKSHITYQILALLLLIFQCAQFNFLVLQTRAYEENTYVPAIVYGLIMSLYFDFFTLTPILMGITFILPAIRNLFSHIEFRAKRDETILYTGLFLAIAGLFYPPLTIFGLCALVIMVLFTGTVPRRYALFIFGFLLPYGILVLYFYLRDGLPELYYNYFRQLVYFESFKFIDIRDLFIIASVPVIFLLFSLFMILTRSPFTNFQARLLRVMGVWLIFSGIFFFLTHERAPVNLTVMVIPLAFFITHFFLIIRRRRIAGIAFMIFVFGISFTSLGTYFGPVVPVEWVNPEKLLVSPGQWDAKVKGKRILILSENLSPLRHALHATPFLDWPLSEEIFTNPGYYDNTTIIYQGFVKDMPEYIIDEDNLIPGVFDKIPSLKLQYEIAAPGLYRLIGE